MSSGKKVGLIVVIALVLAVIGIAIAIPWLFDVDRYRPQVAAQIQQKTGKPAQIGHLALTVLPHVAIRVDDFTIENSPGFPAGDFLKAKKIYAVVNASALLHHKVEITSLELDDLKLDMLEDTHGKWNFENASGNVNPPADSGANNSYASFTLGVISKLTVEGGQLAAASLLPSGAVGPSLVHVQGASISLSDVNLDAFTTASLSHPQAPPEEPTMLAGLFNKVVYAQDAAGPTVAQGSFKADELQFGDLTVTKVSSQVRLLPKQVFADNLELQCYNGSATGNLSLNFAGANLNYSVDAQLKDVNVEKLLTAFPQAKGMMSGTLEGTAKMNGLLTHSANPLAGITGSGQAAVHNGKMPSLRLNDNLRSMAKMANVGPANGDPSSFSSLSADFHIADGKLASNKIILIGNGMDVDGSGSMSMAGEGSLDYQGDASLAASGNNPLTTILAGLSGGKAANGKITFPFAVSGTFAKPRFALKGVGGAGGALPAAVQQPADVVRGLSGLFKKK